MYFLYHCNSCVRNKAFTYFTYLLYLLSLEVFSPAQILLILPTTAIRHCFSFSSFSITSFWNLKICCYLFLLFFPVFFSALSIVHPSILFYFSFYPLFFFSLCLFTLFSDLLYCFIFKSAILSFLFSY